MRVQVIAAGVVEHQSSQGSGLVCSTEVVVVIVDAAVQGDGHRVVDDAVGPGCLGRSLMQC